jgi:hypothetical protein
MHINDAGLEDLDWIHLAPNGDYLYAVVNKRVKLHFP